jgi:hypothetical protein
MQLHLYMVTVIWRLTNPVRGAKIHFCTWLQEQVHEGTGKLEVLFFSNEACHY